MNIHQVNLFEIANLSNLKCSYKLLQVGNLPRDEYYEKNINLLAKRLAYQMEQPVTPIFGGEHTRLAIPASSALPEPEQSLAPHIATLTPLEEIHILDFEELDAQSVLIAKNFLRFAFQRPLMKNPELWEMVGIISGSAL